MRAVDGGLYDARSSRANVRVTIDDVNDNSPVFLEYPFSKTIQPHVSIGEQLLQVRAEDPDQGPNADIVYR